MINTKTICTLGLIAIAGELGYFSGKLHERLTTNAIPDQEVVEEGYIAPNRVEVLCYDHDSMGLPETEVRIDGRPFLLREVDGDPVLSKFTIWSGHRPIGDGKFETFPARIEVHE